MATPESVLSAEHRFVLTSGALKLNVAPGKGNRAAVMGVLNVTPDSFSDGGLFLDTMQAVTRAGEMIRDGASIIDVGGASSRPTGSTYGKGALKIAPEVESERIGPVIREISSQWPGVMISVDTFTASVARHALDAGAHIVNDITALRSDLGMASLIAERNVPVILMHSIGDPGEMPHSRPCKNVVESVRTSLQEAINHALEAGIRQLVVDPGFGFGKSTADNLKLISAIREFVSLGWPVLVGVSRKSSIGRVLGSEEEPVPVSDRLYGSLGATAVAVLEGATIIRTHDVRATFDMLKVLDVSRPSEH